MRWGVISTPRVDTESWRLPELGDVALAWRDQVSEARARLREALWPCAQAALAAGLAWLIAHNLLGHAEPFFAPIAAAISLSTNRIRRGRRILQMVAGVMLGVGLGVAATWVMGTSALSIGVTVLVTMVVGMALAVGVFGEGMMFVNQSAAAAVLIIALHKHGSGSERAIDALVGGVVAAVIGVGLFPADPLLVMRRAEREVLRSLAGALARVAELLHAGTAAQAGWTLAATQDVHSQLASLAAARMSARANARVAPRRWHLRGEVASEDARIARLDLLANAALSLFRLATDALAEGERVSPELCTAVAGLAAALDSLARTQQPWPPALRHEVATSVDEALATIGPPGAPRAPVIASMLRETGRDLLAVLPQDAN
jgi:uncharacterized membrane protein YgaE (UPF0421/DUF939 family)